MSALWYAAPTAASAPISGWVPPPCQFQIEEGNTKGHRSAMKTQHLLPISPISKTPMFLFNHFFSSSLHRLAAIRNKSR